MKVKVIKGGNGCQEIDIDMEDVNGMTSDRELRLLFVKNRKYRLTLESHKELAKTLRSQMWLNKCLIY